MHFQARAARKPKAEHAELEVWRKLWAGKGIYVKTIVLPNGSKIDVHYKWSTNTGGCRAVWR